jgi:predicted metal-dependent HD superfamily phosphohydrolase
MKINNAIVAEAAEYVSDYLSKHLCDDFCYHDFFHTFSVVNAVNRLCAVNDISKQEKKILLTAAWFHDTGYTQQTDEHEEQGALITEAFLKNKNVDDEEIEQVKACILATQYPQQPKNVLEQIICDADMLHVSENNFIERSNLLRKEWQATKSKIFTDKEWWELNIEFLNKHSFHTSYCRRQFDKSKSENLKTLGTKLEQLNSAPVINDKQKPVTAVMVKKEKKKSNHLLREELKHFSKSLPVIT